jgi:hypothetical protein
MREQQFRRALEELAGEVLKGALARGGFLHRRRVPVHAAFLFVLHVALLFERAQDGQHRGVGERVVELVLDLVHDRRAAIPQDPHDVGFAIGQVDFVGHRSLTTRCLVVNASTRRVVN